MAATAITVSARPPTHPRVGIPHHVLADPHLAFLIGIGILIFLLLLWMPITREILKEIIGKLLIPGFSAIFQISLRWLVKKMKWIAQAHYVLGRNLLSSYHNIHPTLKKPKR